MHSVITSGVSRSFPVSHPLLESAASNGSSLLLIGVDAGAAYATLPDKPRYQLILIELGNECLGVHTGESGGLEGSNTVGFARFRMGESTPSNLVEIVRQPATPDAVVAEAVQLFQLHGLKTAVCRDFPGRIVNRLMRPYFNAVLRRLDEGLATAADLDLTLKLGLGYPEGPVGLLERTGLADHHDVTLALYHALGDAAYAPARRAQVARRRQA